MSIPEVCAGHLLLSVIGDRAVEYSPGGVIGVHSGHVRRDCQVGDVVGLGSGVAGPAVGSRVLFRRGDCGYTRVGGVEYALVLESGVFGVLVSGDATDG